MIDLGEALLVRAARKSSFAEGLLSAAAAGVFVAILAIFFVGKPELIVLAVLAASVAFAYAIRAKRFELRITRLKFVSRGRIGDNFGSTRSVCASDVQWLEYQEDTTGPETAHHPAGLYAVLEHRSVCLLPDVDEQQTSLIIERIKERFPNFRGQWRGQSPFGKHLTSLGLNETPQSAGKTTGWGQASSGWTKRGRPIERFSIKQPFSSICCIAELKVVLPQRAEPKPDFNLRRDASFDEFKKALRTSRTVFFRPRRGGSQARSGR